MNNKRNLAVILFLAVLAAFVAGCGANAEASRQRDHELNAAYRTNLLDLADKIVAHAELAGEVLDAYAEAWDNPAIRNQDFTVALTGVRRTLDGTVNAIVNGREEVAATLADLGEAPKSLQEAHGTLQDMFASYSAMVQLCDQPSGTLDAFKVRVDELRKQIREGQAQIDALQ